MKKLILAAVVSAISGTSQFALASSDETGCGWSDYCSMSGVPYLAADNDTRVNLLMLAAGMHNLPVTLSSLPQDISRNRGYTFGVFPGAAAPATDQATAPAQTAVPQENPLNAQALSLGIKPSGLTGVTEENEGRWVSNNSDSLSQFFQALLADRQLDQAERDLLALRRAKIYRSEAQLEQFLPLMANYAEGSHAAAFRDYLTSAELFYQGQFADADSGFQRLKESDQHWVAETAAYMLFRVALNQITENATDQYGMFDPQRANKEAGALALQRAQAYLAAYPQGEYVDSVQGLQRRVNWYLSDWPRLAQLYETEIAAATDINTLSAMIDEGDQILLSRNIAYNSEDKPFVSNADAPLLTFTQTMKWLRQYNLDNQSMPKVTDEMLQGYKPMFVAANQLPLWEYMHNAWLFYQQKDYAAVAKAIQPAAQLTANDLIAFSQQILYGNALVMQGNWQGAEAHWRHLLSLKLNPYQQQYVQLMLATALVQENKAAAIFAPNSPINNLRYRSVVLKSLANKALLQQQAAGAPNDEEKTIALHTVLFKDLMVGDYQGFIDDSQLKKNIKQTPDPQVFGDVALSVFDWDGGQTEPGYFCASLAANVAVLAKNKADPHAMNCVAEFLRTTFADINTEAEMGANEGLDDLARTELYKDKAHGRLKYYQQVIADPKAEPEDKTYALYRAVMCFSPSGYNRCDRQEISQKTRQRWFNLLKSQYKGNQWEQKLKYYW
ncbi:hypothetical protein [Serratia silvae]|uniref:Outer membrane assembly lipoprotein YfiO n=1 Tax=Serratia silvae TaxID=2824122 RepID=A0ABT0KC66_9GAMM|nr:hypothetical protein [Serratia silvae]MCL1029407.1 hypothetical protein [Serratia silvae]